MKRTGIEEKKTAQGIPYPMSPRLLPLKDAAHWPGLTVWAMRERIWAGEIPVVRFPGARKMYIDTVVECLFEMNKEVIN